MNKNIYNIDFSKLVMWFTPAAMLKPNMLAWLSALVAPVRTLHMMFLRYRTQKLYELMITPQVCYLERLLNDKYDFVERRIKIIDAQDKPPLYIFREDELKPVYLFAESENKPVYIYTEGEAGDIKDDFVIQVPKSIVFIDNEMMQLVKAYRLAAMQPKIQRI